MAQLALAAISRIIDDPVPRRQQRTGLRSWRLRFLLDGNCRRLRALDRGLPIAGLAGTGSADGAGATCSGADGAAVLWGRRRLFKGGSAADGVKRGDTLGLTTGGGAGVEEDGCAKARLRNARMIFCPAVRIAGKEAGSSDLAVGMPGMSSEDSRSTRGFSVRSNHSRSLSPTIHGIRAAYISSHITSRGVAMRAAASLLIGAPASAFASRSAVASGQSAGELTCRSIDQWPIVRYP